MNVAEKLESVDACLDVLQKETKSNNFDRSTSAYECVSRIALRVSEFDNTWNDMMLEALERSTNDPLSTNHKEKSVALLRLLYKLKNYEKLIQRACDIVETYPQHPSSYEWICKMYIDDTGFDTQVMIDFSYTHRDFIFKKIFNSIRHTSSNQSSNTLRH